MKRRRMVGKNEHYCWWCNRRLLLPYFAEVETDYGKKLRVHKKCLADADHFWAAARQAAGITRATAGAAVQRTKEA